MQLAVDDAAVAAAPLVDPQPLTVIMIHDFAAVRGGAERVALTEAAGLARRGHRVTFVAGNGLAPGPAPHAPDPQRPTPGTPDTGSVPPR